MTAPRDPEQSAPQAADDHESRSQVPRGIEDRLREQFTNVLKTIGVDVDGWVAALIRAPAMKTLLEVYADTEKQVAEALEQTALLVTDEHGDTSIAARRIREIATALRARGENR